MLQLTDFLCNFYEIFKCDSGRVFGGEAEEAVALAIDSIASDWLRFSLEERVCVCEK